MQKLKNIQAFTLVELIVVITILAILGTIGFMSLIGFQKTARESKRISDLNTIAKSLDLFYTQEGYYPNPSNSFDVTFSGSLAWNQGTFGLETQRLIKRISKTPTDPLTDNEYVYSTTNTRKEYELGSITETLFSYSTPDTFFVNQANAAGSYYANVKGNYNKQIVTVRDSDKVYILGVPTIITSEITDVTVQDIISNGSFALQNSKNLPGSYNDKLPEGQVITDVSSKFSAGTVIDTSIPVIYEGTIELLNDDTEKQKFADNLISYYQNSNLTSKNFPGLEVLLDSSTSDSGNALSYVNTLIQTDTGGIPGNKIKVNTITTPTGPIAKTGDATKFISIWDTEAVGGASGTNQVMLPLSSDGVYNFTIDWESDGTIDDTITSYDQTEITHTYSTPGVYTITIDGQIEGFGFGYSYGINTDSKKLTDITQWGNVLLRTDGNQFRSTTLTSFSATDILNFNEDTNITGIFYGNLQFSGDVSNWNISNVTKMDRAFMYLEDFNWESIEDWDVSNVTSMEYTFSDTDGFDGNLQGWDVSNVTNMQYLFSDATNAIGNISGWTINNGRVDYMFKDTENVAIIARNLTFDDTTRVMNIFYNSEDFSGDLQGWYFKDVTYAQNLFGYSVNFTGDVSNWKMGYIDPDTVYNFVGYNVSSAGTGIDTWDTTSLNSLKNIFNGVALTADVSGWDTSTVTSLNGTFGGATNFNSDISGWDVSNITNMNYVFGGTQNFDADISGWDVSNVTIMQSMFGYSSYNPDISSWDVGNVENFSFMFSGNSDFDQDLSLWDVSSATNSTDFDKNTSVNWESSEKPCFGYSDVNGDGKINCLDTP